MVTCWFNILHHSNFGGHLSLSVAQLKDLNCFFAGIVILINSVPDNSHKLRAQANYFDIFLAFEFFPFQGSVVLAPDTDPSSVGCRRPCDCQEVVSANVGVETQ